MCRGLFAGANIQGNEIRGINFAVILMDGSLFNGD